ncbi:gamma-glutamyl-gamma-aminobutyrate hydrolase family protein [Agarivorans sp. MS3-6]
MQYQEAHDSLDERWNLLLMRAGILPILVANHTETASALWQTLKPAGVILTGGGEFSLRDNDVRSRTEEQLVELAKQHNKPLLGICRGMQVLQQLNGEKLIKLEGHVNPNQEVLVNGSSIPLNSYHNYGAKQVEMPFKAWAISHDGVIKAIESRETKQIGIMWHPERTEPFTSRNIEFLNRLFVKQEYPCAHLY